MLLRWAREQQNLTLRDVRALGGPSLGYLSEMEKGKKDHPDPELLDTLLTILNISEGFALGQIPQYTDDPVRCRGLASDVAPRIRGDESLRTMGVLERSCHALRVICTESAQVKKVDVAYILGTAVATLNDLLSGTFPIKLEQMRILADLTGLPEVFFLKGLDETSYQPLVDLAMGLGLTPEEAMRRLESARPHQDGEDGQFSASRSTPEARADGTHRRT